MSIESPSVCISPHAPCTAAVQALGSAPNSAPSFQTRDTPHSCACSNSPPHALQKFRKALFVLPYICVVMEKTAHLQALAAALGITVKGYWADNDVSAPLQPR